MNKKEAWDLPGGGLHFFETSTKGLVREVKEETGIYVHIIEPFSVFDVIKNNIHLTIITYICVCDTYNVTLSDEHDAFYWLTLEDVKNKDIPKWMKKEFEKALKSVK